MLYCDKTGCTHTSVISIHSSYGRGRNNLRMVSAFNYIVGNHKGPSFTWLYWQMATSFFNPTDTSMVTKTPWIGEGPGFDSQGSGIAKTRRENAI